MDCSLVFIGLSIIVHEVCQIKAYQIWLRAIIAKGANADHIGVEKIKIPVQKHFETIGVLERSNNHIISSNPDAINNAARFTWLQLRDLRALSWLLASTCNSAILVTR